MEYLLIYHAISLLLLAALFFKLEMDQDGKPLSIVHCFLLPYTTPLMLLCAGTLAICGGLMNGSLAEAKCIFRKVLSI